MRLVCECVHNIAHGRADEDYALVISKLQAHNMDTGDRFASSSFLGVHRWKLLQIAQLGHSATTGLALTFDTLTSGSKMFSRAETLQVIIMIASISPIDGLLTDHFISFPSVRAQVYIHRKTVFVMHESTSAPVV